MTDQSTFFGFSFRHHGKHTAFHGLANALSDQIIVDASPPWPIWTPHALEWRMNWRWLYYSEYRLKKYYDRKEPCVLHYFFPENTMFRAHEWKRDNKLIVTCHQPVERINKPKDNDPKFDKFIKGVRASDIIVVQCESLVEPYRELFPSSRIECIPLGADTVFFSRSENTPRKSRPRVLTVGNWLRDYKTWAQTVLLLQQQGCDADFIVIAGAASQETARAALGAENDRVTFLSGISDEALRDEYAKADVFLLTLFDAMANDALLESLAMGVPMVITDLPATRDYGGNAALYTAKTDAEAAADAVLNLLNNNAFASKLGQTGRERAENLYSWKVVSDRYRSLYDDLRSA